MTWSVEGRVEGRVVAEPGTIEVSGKATLGGIALTCKVHFQLMNWPGWEKVPPYIVELMPCAAATDFRLESSSVRAGMAHVIAPRIFRPASHASDICVHYELYLSNAEVVEVEERRNAGRIHVQLCLEAIAHTPNGATTTQSRLLEKEIPRDIWVSILSSCGFEERLIFEVPLSREATEPAEATKRLKAAMGRRQTSPAVECVAAARKVVDALKQDGFGGKAPSDVIQFLKGNASRLSMEERYAVLRAALDIYTSPAHHVNFDDEEFTRTDADMALCLAAALVNVSAHEHPRDCVREG